ncbi:MAG: DUF4167 domain-containing protein [Alphaproteobacteria bacterium]|nr:DUF4167 domain-containing protein [Alphaproteobacteria bacterium]
MKQNLPPRRSRGRSNMRSGRAPAHRNQALESNGPEGRVRGTAQQILDRYLAMARDAQSSGDSVLAENLFQHAEHYQRLVAQFAPPQQQPQPAPADAQRNADGAQDSEAEARSDREAADRPEAEGGESTNPRPRRRRRQRNAPVEEAAAETGEATQPQEGASAEEATAEAV